MTTLNIECNTRSDAPVRYIISLGLACCVGLNLKRLGLKMASYPFDWTCMETKYIPIIITQGIQDTYIIDGDIKNRQEISGIKFVHHNLADPNDRAYLERCYQRLLYVLKGQKERVLFINYQVYFRSRDVDAISMCRDTIKEINPDLDFDIISIYLQPNPSSSSLHMYRASEHVIYADVCSRTIWWGSNPHAKGDEDIWDAILKSFTYDLVPNDKHGYGSSAVSETAYDTPFNFFLSSGT
jgi:hypothetical protein